ncbi:MAG: hypothetical protein H6840_11820 [Planctomycetes bacterium]|nr:hypothetical protein [Planctomycetota bacterium]
MEADKTCSSCNGLKVTKQNGLTRIEVSETYGLQPGESLREQLNEALGVANLFAHMPGSDVMHDPEVPSAQAYPKLLSSTFGESNFTLEETDAAGVLGLFQADDTSDDEDQSDLIPSDAKDGLVEQIRALLREDDDIQKELDKLKKKDDKDKDCKCREWKVDWSLTKLELSKTVRGVKVASVDQKPKGVPKQGGKDEAEATVTVVTYDIYSYKAKGAWKLYCSLSDPADCGDAWTKEGEWEADFDVRLKLKEEGISIKHKITEGINAKTQEKIQKEYSDDGKADAKTKGDVPQEDWPKGSIILT